MWRVFADTAPQVWSPILCLLAAKAEKHDRAEEKIVAGRIWNRFDIYIYVYIYA